MSVTVLTGCCDVTTVNVSIVFRIMVDLWLDVGSYFIGPHPTLHVAVQLCSCSTAARYARTPKACKEQQCTDDWLQVTVTCTRTLMNVMTVMMILLSRSVVQSQLSYFLVCMQGLLDTREGLDAVQGLMERLDLGRGGGAAANDGYGAAAGAAQRGTTRAAYAALAAQAAALN